MTVLNLTWFRASPPPEGEGKSYIPPHEGEEKPCIPPLSRGRSGGGWGFVV